MMRCAYAVAIPAIVPCAHIEIECIGYTCIEKALIELAKGHRPSRLDYAERSVVEIAERTELDIHIVLGPGLDLCTFI